MTNTMFDSGTSTLEEMIASISKGYLLEGYQSGMEDPKHWGIQCILGTVCRTPNSIHVTEDELRKTLADFRTNVCVVLDQPVRTADDTRALGVETGDYIALEPRFTLSGGYIKSRFIDDKACAAVLLNIMKAVRDGRLNLRRKVIAYFACYEELGHGTAWLPEGVQDILALDIAPTGPDQNSEEHKVSIFAKDSRFPPRRVWNSSSGIFSRSRPS